MAQGLIATPTVVFSCVETIASWRADFARGRVERIRRQQRGGFVSEKPETEAPVPGAPGTPDDPDRVPPTPPDEPAPVPVQDPPAEPVTPPYVVR